MLKKILSVTLAAVILAVCARHAGSSNNSEAQTRAAAAADTISVKETYVDTVIFDENGKNPTTAYAGMATISGTMALPNQSGASVTADTVFKLTAGALSTTFRVGDDPKFKNKAKKAAAPSQTLTVDFFNGKKPKKVKTSLSISWKPDSLKFKLVIVETSENKILPAFDALKKSPSGTSQTAVSLPIKLAFGTDAVNFEASGDAVVEIVAVDSFMTADWFAQAAKK